MEGGVEGRNEKKRKPGSFRKGMQQMGDELCRLHPYRSGVKPGKADLFIKVSHPSAPYSSAPTNGSDNTTGLLPPLISHYNLILEVKNGFSKF